MLGRSSSSMSSSSAGAWGIYLYIYLPSSGVYNLKCVPDITLKDVINKYKFLLGDPANIDVSRYHIFANGLRLLDEERMLSTYNLRPMSTIEIKRDTEYEFVAKLGNKDQKLCLAGNVKGVIGAKQCCQVLWEGSIKDWSSYDYSFFQITPSNERVQLDGDTNVIQYRLMEGDVVELQIKPKKAGTPGTRRVTVSYSPFSERDKQRTILARSGFLKKQGGGAGGYKNWKKRWFVLTKDNLQYFESEKHLHRPLGTVYLDEISSVSPDPEKSNDKIFYFVISVPGRDLLVSCKTQDECNSWLRCITGMVSCARSDRVFLSETEVEEELSRREVRRMRGTEVRGISNPTNVQHITHISIDWRWSGDVSVFILLEVLGQGVSGKVLRAQVRDAGFEVAIKVCKNMNERVQAELEKEIEVLKQCKHPNIVAYYGTKLVGSEIWIIMDYCGVGSIKDVMKVVDKGCLNEPQIIYVVEQTLKGLTHLHQLKPPVLHLDIKAANILMTEEAEVKLADFGVSETLKTGEVVATDYVGSPLFMSPEVIRKEGYNAKTDIWSLGITVIEMAQGRPPNNDIKRIEDLPLIAERPSPLLSQPQNFTPCFNAFVAYCLTKNVEDRPDAVGLLMHELLRNVPNKSVLKGIIEYVVSSNKREKL